MRELIVIAYHGDQFVNQCVESVCLAALGPNGPVEVIAVDTGPEGPYPGGHPTGAYRWATENFPADRYLFVQDCMTCLTDDPCGWFRRQWPGMGAVAWGRFGMAFDTPYQQEWVRNQYPGIVCDAGIMGPIFYTDRASLGLLADKELLPAIPTSRIEAQGTERAWAYAYTAAGLPVVGPEWNQAAMQVEHGGWRKVWAARP